MDADFTVLVGAWVPNGFCEANIAEVEYDQECDFLYSCHIDVGNEEFCLGVVPYSNEYNKELMGVYLYGVYLYEDFIDGMGEMNAQDIKNALDRAYALEEQIKEVVRALLPDEYKSYADDMEVKIWGIIPW